jgi:RimJ/RimL family protein N-acetyltransferase
LKDNQADPGRLFTGKLMKISVRGMSLSESDLVISYVHQSTPEHLEILGVDPTRVPTAEDWHQHFQEEFVKPPSLRARYYLTRLLDGRAVGYASSDRIVLGEHANMHLHVFREEDRRKGLGTQCVQHCLSFFFEELRLKRMYCELNAFNIGPNRTLQKAGFTYLKTHMTVPGFINFHQAVTRWVIEA